MTSEMESGPALRLRRSQDVMPAVRGVFTMRSPSLVLMNTSPVSEVVPVYFIFGISFLFATVHVLVQSIAGARPLSATQEPIRDT